MRTKAGLGFEATIAPNTTSSLAARGNEEAWMGTGMGALYSRKDFGNLVSAREE
jgi:hypothetical protein